MERRTAPRYPLNAEIEFRVLNPGQEPSPAKGRTIDMSRSGLLFKTDHDLANGAPVEAWIYWPARPVHGERWLYIWGSVVRQSTGAVAIAIRQYSFEEHRDSVRPKLSLPVAVPVA